MRPAFSRWLRWYISSCVRPTAKAGMMIAPPRVTPSLMTRSSCAGIGSGLCRRAAAVDHAAPQPGIQRRRGAAGDRRVAPLLKKARQIAGVVNVRVGQHHPVDGFRIDRELIPVPKPQLFEPLVEAAVHEEPAALRLP